ncbi:MAG TPA: phage tail protein [Pyrinomonadaceae bacterium]|jgi:phage tail-like protein|nr:phage tail protein [Pyrinomonadaceae bacterium]
MKQNEIKQFLPAVIQRTVQEPDEKMSRPGNLMYAFLQVMEDLHVPTDNILGKIDAVFDPYRTADRFVPFLASWVDFDYVLGGLSDEEVLSSPDYAARMACIRDLIANAAFLSQWRGTSKGLMAFLELATGVTGFKIEETVLDESQKIKPFHLKILIPPAAEQFTDLIRRIVDTEKPIYVTYELEVLKLA